MKQRTLLLSTIVAGASLFIGGGLLLAQPNEGGRHHGPRAERGHHRGPMQALRSLDLTEEQQAEARQILESRRELLEPLHDEGRALRDQMRELHSQENPDAEALGNLMLEGKALREEIRSHHEASWEEIRALLTPEQLEKLALLEEMRDQRRSDRRERGGRHGSKGGSGGGPHGG